MKEIIKYLSWTNIIGFPIISIILIVYFVIYPSAWFDFYISLNIFISIPFIIAGVTSLKNIKDLNLKKTQKTLIIIFLILWIPSIGLPFVYEAGGVLISLTIMAVGIWAIFKLKKALHKLFFITIVSSFFLILNVIMILTLFFAEQ